MHVQHVNGMAAQFAREDQRNTHQRGVRQRQANDEIRPAICKTIHSRLPGDVDCVLILLIEFSESFDQINSVGFVAAESGSH